MSMTKAEKTARRLKIVALTKETDWMNDPELSAEVESYGKPMWQDMPRSKPGRKPGSKQIDYSWIDEDTKQTVISEYIAGGSVKEMLEKYGIRKSYFQRHIMTDDMQTQRKATIDLRKKAACDQIIAELAEGATKAELRIEYGYRLVARALKTLTLAE